MCKALSGEEWSNLEPQALGRVTLYLVFFLFMIGIKNIMNQIKHMVLKLLLNGLSLCLIVKASHRKTDIHVV